MCWRTYSEIRSPNGLGSGNTPEESFGEMPWQHAQGAQPRRAGLRP
jgi:hypothetical protein